MVRRLNSVKVQEWTQRLARFSASSHRSVAQFCDAEGVSTASFYQWQRKLQKLSSSSGGKDAAANSAQPPSRRGGFRTVQVTSFGPLSAFEPVLTVCLPDGMAVQVADHPATIEAVLRQLLGGDHPRTGARGGAAC